LLVFCQLGEIWKFRKIQDWMPNIFDWVKRCAIWSPSSWKIKPHFLCSDYRWWRSCDLVHVNTDWVRCGFILQGLSKANFYVQSGKGWEMQTHLILSWLRFISKWYWCQWVHTNIPLCFIWTFQRLQTSALFRRFPWPSRSYGKNASILCDQHK
jgi:hypothetical protein